MVKPMVMEKLKGKATDLAIRRDLVKGIVMARLMEKAR
jgi:hypothetical protein